MTDLFKEIKQTLAECLFCLACQQPLDKADVLRLIAHLQADNSLQADQTMDPVSLCLLMTLAACFDITPLEQENAGEFCIFNLHFKKRITKFNLMLTHNKTSSLAFKSFLQLFVIVISCF